MHVAFGRNVLASVFNAGTVIVTALASVPLILDRIGIAGYGIWTLAVTAVTYVAIVETGIGPAVQRFVANARGRGADHELAPLLWSTLLAYLVLALLGFGLLAASAGAIVDLFDVPGSLRADAKTMFRIVGIALGLALLVAGTGNVLMGLERFPRLAVAAGTGSLAFLAAVVVLLWIGNGGLVELGWAIVIQQTMSLGLRLWFLRDLLGAPVLVSGARLREVARFSLRLQVTALTELFNWQADRVIVGLATSPATLGQYGIGAQLADGGRLLAGASLNPVNATLAVTAGTGDAAALDRRFRLLNRLWLVVAAGTAIIGAATVHPLVAGWLGEGYGLAATCGMLLVLGSGCGLTTGVGVAYMRAIGRPGLEARYGLRVFAANLLLTIPLAVAAGAIGVAVGSFVAYASGMAWFWVRLHGIVGLAGPGAGRAVARVGALALLAAGASLAWGEAMVALLPTGVALAAVLAGLAAALVAYVLAAMRLRPTRAALGMVLQVLRPPASQRAQ